MRKYSSRIAFLLLTAVAPSGCGDVDDPEPRLAEGVFAPLGEARPNATAEELAAFERGRQVGITRFSPEQGLGPDFNSSFCLTCHEKPAVGGGAGRYRNFLLVGEGLSDGSFTPLGKSGVQLHYSLDGIYVPTDDEANVLAQRNPTPFFGVGLLAELSESVILANADPDDVDGDGISGRANLDRGFVGRFGRKAQTVSIEGFIRGPLFNHLGITSDPLSNERKADLPVPSALSMHNGGTIADQIGQVEQAQAAAPDEPTTDDDDVTDPELSEEQLFDLVSFTMLLAAPRADEQMSEEAQQGQSLFEQVRCSACHVPTLLGPRGLLPLYSDLLIHDMGSGLADGVSMGLASGREFRTQPLWGVAASAPYLHDGRADTLDEAIRLHGGEAEASRDAYLALGASDQDAILAFLGSLGGSAQLSAGLIAPDTPIAATGELGGPWRELDDSEKQQFLLGRALFDRDRFKSEGLGPRFNGDSCRACHFDPVVGGAGPADVDVTRHGIVNAEVFQTPAIGTMVHRHDLDVGTRPPIDPLANFFEHRQTPSILGLGLIDQISEATIVALADPDDADNDGISGRAHVLGDGRIGRLGWKASVPSVAEFARDALFNEMGVTLPAQAGLSFGALSDDDSTKDPEISVTDIEALVFYMNMLAPPPRRSTNAALEAQGEAAFAAVGCGACHVPELKTADEVPVALYSDLLLHDVAPSGASGIADGQASMGELRTPPLWGIAQTAPYMHDGLAYSLEQAILRHDGEAADVVKAYKALPDAQRAALIAFLESL